MFLARLYHGKGIDVRVTRQRHHVFISFASKRWDGGPLYDGEVRVELRAPEAEKLRQDLTRVIGNAYRAELAQKKEANDA